MSANMFKIFAETAGDLLKQVSANALTPHSTKTLNRVFKLAETAALLGISESYLRKKEKEDPQFPQRQATNGRPTGWTLPQINEIRDLMGLNPYRDKDIDPVSRIITLNFKGGVGKTTTSLYLAQYLALRGYRVLVVDLDSQASLTGEFIVNPDETVDPDNTLAPYFCGEVDSLRHAVQPTYWPRIDIIPANLGLYRAEFVLPARQARDEEFRFWELLDNGLKTVEQDYDVIIMDAPPSLSYISINGAWAANAMVIPIPPAKMDFSSAKQFFEMLYEVLEPLNEKAGVNKEYEFIRLLITKFDGQAHSREIAGWVRKLWGQYVVDNVMANTTVINAAGMEMTSVYEIQKYEGSNRTLRRALELLDGVNAEIEQLIRMSWPSQREQAQQAAVL